MAFFLRFSPTLSSICGRRALAALYKASMATQRVACSNNRLLHTSRSPLLFSSGENENKNSSQEQKGPVSWKSVGVLIAAGSCLLVFAEYVKQQRKEKLKETKALPSVGQAALGGPFVLVDSHGKTVTTLDLKGNWLLIYFGFTFCPDICPNELAKMTEIVNVLDKRISQKVVPVFITIDPERDTPEKIGEYVMDYHPRFLALTGSTQQIADVTRKFRVYFTKAPTGDGPLDYLVDHSIITFLVDPNGEFVEYYGKNKTIPEVVDSISKRIKEYRS